MEDIMYAISKQLASLELVVLMYVCKASKRNAVSFLRNSKSLQYVKMCDEAAEKGHLEVLHWLRSLGYKWSNFTCQAASRGGNLNVLKWLRSNGCDWDWKVYKEAIKNNNMDIYNWALTQGCQMSVKMFHVAAKYNNLTLILELRNIKPFKDLVYDINREHILQDGSKFNYNEIGINITDGAAKGGRIDIIKWARAERYCCLPYTIVYGAAKNGHLKVLEECCVIFILTHFPAKLLDAARIAARKGNLEVLEWLNAKMLECNETMNDIDYERLYKKAIRGGQTKILEWISKQTKTIFKTDIVDAIAGGRVELLKNMEKEWGNVNQSSWGYMTQNGWKSCELPFPKFMNVMEWIHNNYRSYKQLYKTPAEMINRTLLEMDRHQENFAKYT